MEVAQSPSGLSQTLTWLVARDRIWPPLFHSPMEWEEPRYLPSQHSPRSRHTGFGTQRRALIAHRESSLMETPVVFLLHYPRKSQK